jgi:membrane-associated protease RseP (regulator of RpoE activity)
VGGPDASAIERLRPKFQDRRSTHLLLLLATAVSTTLSGGVAYSVTILLILGAHEMGHYLACRYYQVDASLPFFIPSPLLFGTFGAFIRIREPIPTKRMLFDIGAAGPFAGFLVALPALIIGISLSQVETIPSRYFGPSLGEPLLFQAVTRVLLGPVPEGSAVFLHPVGMAAWFGLLATALNLFPIGQLDGGHISYAVLGRRSTIITIAMTGVAISLTVFFSRSWLVWTMLLLAMIVSLGPRHPRTLDEDEPIDRSRRILAGFALLMLVICFTPRPIELVDLLRGQ